MCKAGMIGRGVLVALVCVGSASAPAWAVDVPIANAGFESPSLTAGGFTYSNNLPGWTVTNGNTNTGVFNPLTWMPPGAWVGAQMGYSNGGILQQIVPATAQENNVFTLTYRIIHRPGYLPVGRVQLWAGAVLLGEEVETAANRPVVNGFGLRTVRAVIPAGSAAIGQSVRIVINSVGATQLDFDDFRLDLVRDGNTCPADFNGDGFVDDTDFVIFTQRYDEFIAQPDGLCDFNADGFVDDFDFTLFAAAYSQFVCE